MMKRTILTLSLLVGLAYAPQAQIMMLFTSDSLTNITSPLDVDSLFYWFAADQGVTTNNNKVTQWNDLSGNGYHVTQADTSMAPSFEATGGPGSRPTMTFDGTNDFLASAAHFWESDDMTIFIVMKFANATRDVVEVFFTKVDDVPITAIQWSLSGRNIAGSYNLYASFYNAGNTANTVLDQNGAKETTWRSLAWVKGATATTLHKDGASQTITRVVSGTGDNTIYNGSSELVVGSNLPTGGSVFLLGSISEIIVYSRALTATERLAIENYLNKKYDLY